MTIGLGKRPEIDSNYSNVRFLLIISWSGKLTDLSLKPIWPKSNSALSPKKNLLKLS